MALSNNNTPSTSSPDITHIKNHTEEICHSIKRIFRHRRADIEDQRQIITTTRKWVEKIILDITSCERRVAIDNAVSSIICALDEVSIQLATSKKKKRLQALIKSTEYTPQKRKRRQRTNTYSVLHNTGYIDSDEEDDLSNLYLGSNSNRHRRAKRSSCSMKDAINAPVSKPVEDDIDLMVKTLKRDLYNQLAEFDRTEIKAILDDKQDIGGDNIIQTKVKELVSTVLNRVEVHPSSPALRLSAIITIDSLHELELRDLGYRSLLTDLLQGDYVWSLKFYAEILSECSMYEDPITLLQSLTALMQRALDVHKLQNSIEHCVELRKAISHTMVRRQSVLSSCGHKSKYCSILKKELEDYRCLCDNMSLQFDSISHWITPSMSKVDRKYVISALQSEGILTLFSVNEDEDDCTEQPTTANETYPFPESLSLRAAYDRLEPCKGMDRLISDSILYEQSVMQQDYSDPSMHYKDECGPLSNMSDDILVNVLSFSGYRSLARASQCCKSWNRASNSSTMWAGVYFNKYRRRCKFEFEYTPNDDAASIIQRNSSFKGFLARCHTQEQIEGHDLEFKHIFKSRYTKEKISNARTCNVIGCMYMIHNKTPEQYTSHMKRHETSIRVKNNHNKRCNVLKKKVQDLQEQTAEWTEFNTPVQTHEEWMKINSPKAVLRDLVFPYLDYRSVIVSSQVCKLWTELSRSSTLWQELYKHHFGARSIKYTSPSLLTINDWKQVFQTKMTAKKRVKDYRNPLGWPLRICSVPNCNKEFQSKVLFELHILKHEEMYCCEAKKVMVSTDWQ